MKFKVNDEVKIKTLDEMIKSKDLVVSENDLYIGQSYTENVYVHSK
jgi:hypothetical protein